MGSSRREFSEDFSRNWINEPAISPDELGYKLFCVICVVAQLLFVYCIFLLRFVFVHSLCRLLSSLGVGHIGGSTLAVKRDKVKVNE